MKTFLSTFSYYLLFSCLYLSNNFSNAYELNAIQKNSLLYYSKSKYSQRGEEGILEEILRRLNIKKGFFVEFGGADGKYFSNARFLAELDWKGAFIEAHSDLFQQLLNNCKEFSEVMAIKEFVTWDLQDKRGSTLDIIADKYFPGQEIDFLSIDIDGADYLILDGLKCRPKIICVEGGFAWSPRLTKKVPDEVALQNMQQPLAVIFEIAIKKGYTPVCFTQNTFLIRNDYAQLFEMISNDAVTLWEEALLYWKLHFPSEYNFIIDYRNTNPLVKLYEKDLLEEISINSDIKKTPKAVATVVDIIGEKCEDVLNYVKQYLPEDPQIIEAGAFNGMDTKKMSRFWPRGTIHTFEPVPELHAKVLSQISDCNNVKAYKLALAETEGTAVFNLSEINPGEVSGSSSLLKPKETLIYDPYIKFGKQIEVPTITIKKWAELNEIKNIDFLWLDMQGSELNALKASGDLLDTVKVIYTEVELAEAYEGQFLYADVKSWIESKGFTEVARDFKIPHYWFWGDAIFVRNELITKVN